VSTGQRVPGRSLFPAFGLRLALWYAALFVGGSVLIVYMTYWLTAASLAQRDRDILQSTLGQYAAVYARGGLRALTDTVQAEQRAAPERLFVRIVDRGQEAIVLSQPEGWVFERLETASLRLTDGTLVQVGKSTAAREELLARFRAALGVVLEEEGRRQPVGDDPGIPVVDDASAKAHPPEVVPVEEGADYARVHLARDAVPDDGADGVELGRK